MTQDRLNKIVSKMNEVLPLVVTSEFVLQLISELSQDSMSYFETQEEDVVAAYLNMMLMYHNTN